MAHGAAPSDSEPHWLVDSMRSTRAVRASCRNVYDAELLENNPTQWASLGTKWIGLSGEDAIDGQDCRGANACRAPNPLRRHPERYG
jgi:hypothetical protein